MLSFGYTLVGNDLQSLLDGMGFDPFVGVYHEIDYGRPSLALDLLEEFRTPLVDRFVLRVWNRRQLTVEDFEIHPSKGAALTRESMKKFFAAFEEFVSREFQDEGETVTLRRLFRRQAHRMARAIQYGEAYRPFQLEC